MSFSLSDIDFFRAHAGDFQLELPNDHLKAAEFLRARFGDHGRAVAELLKARGIGKLPARWLADSDSAQQATPLPVAAERARFLSAAGVGLVHDVTCSIGTEMHTLADAHLTTLGSDLDPVRLVMARHNLGEDAWLLRADATTVTSRADVVVADPARRSGGRRITDPSKLLPPLPDLLEAHQGRELAVKCAPGLDFSDWEGLVTVTSLDGGVKEACLYTPGLGTGRKAVLLRSDGSRDEVTDEETDLPEAGGIGKYVLDPDGAIVRAGLVRHYAAREGLHQLDPRIAYLTGDRIPAGASGFEFIEAVPVKRLKSALQAAGVGRVEILVRGLNVDPDNLRKKLKLKGSNARAVILTRIGTKGIALVCHPRVVSSENNYAT